jgi:hypothetical protein
VPPDPAEGTVPAADEAPGAGSSDGEASGGGEAADAERRDARRGARARDEPGSAAAPEPTPSKTAPPAETPRPATPAKAEKASGTDLDALLAGATAPVVSKQPSGGAAAEAVKAAVGSESAGSDVPDQPSRSQVRRAMGSVAGQVMACSSMVNTQTRVNATLTVVSSGAVQDADVTGGPPDVQQCVRRAVMRARFPQFQQPTFSVTYPFVLSPPE